jgi:2-iminoacetate synthase ThiH
MSLLAERALEAAGLVDVLAARRARTLDGSQDDALRQRLAATDLLALGALADRVRVDEVGDAVTIFANVAPDTSPDVIVVDPDGGRDRGGDAGSGMDYLRKVALARVLGPRAARVRVDWQKVGLELAQVALGFGASELVGVIATRRGLPIADGMTTDFGKRSERESLKAVKKRELEGFVARSGRRAVFADEQRLDAIADASEETYGDEQADDATDDVTDDATDERASAEGERGLR